MFVSLSLLFFSSCAPLLLTELWHKDKLHRSRGRKQNWRKNKQPLQKSLTAKTQHVVLLRSVSYIWSIYIKADGLNIGNISQHNATQFNGTNCSIDYELTVQNLNTKTSWNVSADLLDCFSCSWVELIQRKLSVYPPEMWTFLPSRCIVMCTLYIDAVTECNQELVGSWLCWFSGISLGQVDIWAHVRLWICWKMCVKSASQQSTAMSAVFTWSCREPPSTKHREQSWAKNWGAAVNLERDVFVMFATSSKSLVLKLAC